MITTMQTLEARRQRDFARAQHARGRSMTGSTTQPMMQLRVAPRFALRRVWCLMRAKQVARLATRRINEAVRMDQQVVARVHSDTRELGQSSHKAALARAAISLRIERGYEGLRDSIEAPLSAIPMW